MPSVGNSASTNAQITSFLRKVKLSTDDFDKKTKKKILARATRPLVKAARTLAPKSTKPHYRYTSGSRIKYNPGNLRRSIKRILLNKSTDVFVGPQFAKQRVMEYGGPGQPTDAYYAAMVFGSAQRFNAKVLAPALAATSSTIISEVEKAGLVAIKNHANARGIKIT